MALTQGDVVMWEALGELGVIPARPRVLEIGQANWWGDVEPPEDCRDECKFETARRWYKKILNFRGITAIDFQGKDALRFDLNEPLPLDPEQVFDIVINTGTLEHVFDQRQLMQTIHERCAVNGLMVHAVPWTGWDNHGFYNYHPCFFHDLATANRYEGLHQITWKCELRRQNSHDIQENTMMYIALRKTRDLPFKVPMQSRLGLM